MRWEDEPYIKAYKRETPEWTLHPWEVRALHLYILKFMDRAGLLELGKSGMKALASLTRVPVEVLEACLPTWLDDGCLQLVPDGKGGQYLFSPSFLEAQEAKQTDAARKRAERERSSARARAAALGLLPASTGHVTSESNDPPVAPATVQLALVSGQPVTPRDAPVPMRTDPSHLVTESHSEQYITEQSTAEQLNNCGSGAHLRQSGTYPTELSAWQRDEAEVLAELRRWPIFERIGDLPKHANNIAGLALSAGKKIAWVCNSIAKCAADLGAEEARTGVDIPADRVTRALMGYVNKTRRPQVTPEEAELKPEVPHYRPAEPPRSVIKAAYARRGQNLDDIERANAQANRVEGVRAAVEASLAKKQGGGHR